MRGTLHVARRSSSTSSSGEVSGELAGGGGDGGEEGVDNSSSGVVLLSALPRGGHCQDAAMAGGIYGGGDHQQVSKLTTPNNDSSAISSKTTHDMTLPSCEYVSKTLPRSAKLSPNHSQNDVLGAMTSQANGANGIASVDTGVKVRPKSSTMKNLKLKLRRKSSGELPISNTAVLLPDGEPPPSAGEREKKGRRGLLGSKTLSRSMENLFKRNKLSKAATIDIGEPVEIIPCYDENHRPERLTKGASSQPPRSGGSGSQPQLMRSQSLDNLDVAADGDTNVDNVDLTVTSGYQKTRTAVITGVGVGAGVNYRRQTGIITNGSIPRPQGAPPPVPVMGSATRRLRSRSLDLSSQQRQVILTAINIDETPDVESKYNDDAFVDENNQGDVDAVGNVEQLDKRDNDHNVSGELSNASGSVSRERYNSDYSDFSDYSEYSNCSSFQNSSSIYSSGSANNYTVNPPVTDHLYGNIATIFPSPTSNVNNNNDDNDDDDYGWSDDEDDDGSSAQPVITENVYGNAAVVAAAKAGLAEKWRDNMETEPSKEEEEAPGQVALSQHLQQHVEKHQHGQHTMLDTAAARVTGLEVGANSNSTVRDTEDTNPSRQSSPVVMPGAWTMTKTSTFSRNDAIQQDKSRDCPAVPPGSGGGNQAVQRELPGESAGAVLEEKRQKSLATGGSINANIAIQKSPELGTTGAGLRPGGQKTPGLTWRTKQELPALPHQSPPSGSSPRHLGLDVRKSTPPGSSTVHTGSGAKTQQSKRRATTLVRPSLPPPEVPSATPVSPTTTHAPQKVVAHGLQYLVDDTKDGIVVCDDLEWALKQFDDIICEDEDDGTKLCPEADDIEENKGVTNSKKEDFKEASLKKETDVGIKKSVLEVNSETKLDHSKDTSMGFKSKNVLLKIKQLEEEKLVRGKHWEGGKEEATPKDSEPSDGALIKGRKGILKAKGDKGKLGASSQAVGMLLERKQKEQVNQWQREACVQDGKDTNSHVTPTDWQKTDLGRSQSPTRPHHHQVHHQKPASTTGAPPHNKPPFTYNKNPDIVLHNKHVSGATGSESTLSEIGQKTHLKTSHDHHQTTNDWPVVKDGTYDSIGTSVEDNKDNSNGADSMTINPKEDILQQELKSHIQRLRQRSGLVSTNLSANSRSVEEGAGGGGGIVGTDEGRGQEESGKGDLSGNLVTKGMVPKKGPPLPVPKKPSGLMDKLVRGTPHLNSTSDSLNESQPISTTPIHVPQPELTAPKNIKTKPGLMTTSDRYGNKSNNWHDEDSGAPGGIPAHSVNHGGVGVKGGGGAKAKSSPGQCTTDQSLEHYQQQHRPQPLSPPSLPLSKVLSSGALAARRREMIGVSCSESGDAGDGGPRSGVVLDTGALTQASHLKVSSTTTGKTNTDRSTKVTSNQDLSSSMSSNDVTSDVDTSGGSIADRIKLLSGSKELHPGGEPVKSSKPSVPPKSAQTVRRFREKLSSSGSEKVRSPSNCSERSLSPSWSPDRLHGNHRLMQGTSEEVFSCHDNDDAGYARLNATSAAYIRSNTPRGFSPRSPTKFKFNIGNTGPKSPRSKTMSSNDSLNMVPAKPEKTESPVEKSLAIKCELGKVLQNKSHFESSLPDNFPAGKSQTSKSPERQKPALKEVAMYAKVNKISANPSLQLVSTGERVILTPSQIKAKVQARNKSTSATKWGNIPPELPAKPTGLKPDPPRKSKLKDNGIAEGKPVGQLKGASSENKPRAIKRRPTLPKKPGKMLAKLRSQSAEDLLSLDPSGAVGTGEEGGGDEGVVYSDGEEVYNDVGPGINAPHLSKTPHTLPPSAIPNMAITTTEFSPDTYDDIDMLTSGCRGLNNRQLPAVPTGGECKKQADAGVATLHHNSLYADDSELAHQQDGDNNINRRRTPTNREISALHERALSGSNSEAGADKDSSTHTSRADISGTASVGKVGALPEDLYEDIGSPPGNKGKGTGVSDTSSKGAKPWISSSHGYRHRRRDQYEQVSIDDSEEEQEVVDNKQEQQDKGYKVGEEKGGEEKESGPQEVSATGNTSGEASYRSELSLPVSRAEGVYEELPDPDDHRSSSASRRVAAAKGAIEDGSDRRTQAPVARIQPFRPHAYDEVCIDDDGDGTPTIINTNPSQPQPNKPTATKHLSKLANILKQNKLNFNKSKNSQEVETESEDPPTSKLKASLSSPCINSGGEFFPEEEQLGMSSCSDRKLTKRTSLGGATTTSSTTEDAISLNSYTGSISSMGSTPGGLNGDGEGDANWRRERRQVKSLIMDEQLMEGNEHMSGRGYSSADSLSIHSGSDSTMSADSTGEAKMTHDDHMKHLAKVNQKVNKSLGARHLSKLYVATLKEKTATLKEKTSNIRNLPKYFSKSATSLQMASRKSLGDISGQMSRMLKKTKQPSAPTPDYTSQPSEVDFSDGDWSDSEFDGDYEVANNGPVIMNYKPPRCTNSRSDLTIEASYLHPPHGTKGMQPPKLLPSRQHRPLPPTPQQGQPEMEEDYLAPSNPIIRGDDSSPLLPRYPAPTPPGVPNGTSPWKREEEHEPDDYEEMGVNRGGFTNSPPIPKPPIPSSSSASDIASILNARNGLRKTGQGQGVQTPHKPPIAARPETAPKPRTPPRPAPKPAAKPFRQWQDTGGVPAPAPDSRAAAADNTGVATPPDFRQRAIIGGRKLPSLPVGFIPNLKSPEITKRNPWKDSTPATPPSPPPTTSIPALPRGVNIGGPPLPTPPRPQRTIPGPPSIPSQRQPLAVTPQSDLDDLYSYYWFHGTMTRDEVTERLYSINEDGTYILRNSNKGGKDNPYTLSILYNEKVWNLHIRLRTDSTYALGNHKDNEKTFSSVPELVEYHTQRNLILAGSRGGETTLIDCPSVIRRDHSRPR